MKQKIMEFLRNKFNISLIVLQCLAIVCYFLSAYVFFLVMFFVLESAFLIVWGVKYLHINRHNKYKLDIYDQLPYTDAEKEVIKKNNIANNKNNKTIAIMLIMLGVILFFSGISVIF